MLASRLLTCEVGHIVSPNKGLAKAPVPLTGIDDHRLNTTNGKCRGAQGVLYQT
jgi:hypothetical protein